MTDKKITDEQKLRIYSKFKMCTTIDRLNLNELGIPHLLDCVRLKSTRSIYEFFKFMTESEVESMYIAFVSGNMRLRDFSLVSVGGTDNVQANLKEVVRKAVERNSNHIIVIHNHPSGDTEVSEGDMETCIKLWTLCELCDIKLENFVLITKDSVVSVIDRIHSLGKPIRELSELKFGELYE